MVPEVHQATIDPIYGVAYSSAIRGDIFERGSFQARFRVYFQRDHSILARQVADLLCRFACCGQDRLSSLGIWSLPGGENSRVISPFFLDEADRGGGRELDGKLYLLDARSPRRPVELAREVAHELSHLTLTGVRGFGPPEDWSNGYLGEVLLLGFLGEDADEEPTLRSAAGQWATARSEALETVFLKLGPAELSRRASREFWAFEGYLLYVRRMYGSEALARLLRSAEFGDLKPTAVAASAGDALQGPAALTIPGSLGIPLEPISSAPGPGLELPPGSAVRTWVLLPVGTISVKVDAEAPAPWSLRGAYAPDARSWTRMFRDGTESPRFFCPSRQWCLFQWRNTGRQPVRILGWSWTPQRD